MLLLIDYLVLLGLVFGLASGVFLGLKAIKLI